MLTDLQTERQRTQQLIQALRAAEEKTFVSGRNQTLGAEPLPVVIVVGLDAQHPSRHLVRLGSGLVGPPIARWLACGIVSNAGPLVAARRTNGSGHFAVDLDQGQYRLRFVNEVRDDLDVEILERIGDALAADQLAAAGIDRMAAMVDEARKAAAAAPSPVAVSARPLRLYDRHPQFRIWRLQAAGTAGLAGAGTWLVRTRGQTRGVAAVPPGPTYVQIRGDQLVLRYPAEQIPYGAVRIFARQEDLLLGTCVLALAAVQDGDSLWCTGSVPWRQLIAERKPEDVSWYVQPATEATLALFTADEIATLLRSSQVQRDSNLQQNLQRLLELLESQTS